MAAYNFPNSPSDGDTVTSNGITYTYSSSKTRWDGAAPSGSSTTVYATIDLLPLSGASTGDQAYVSGNNRLYIWNGTGWYNIALINTTPSISGVSSSYALETDGTATTVTITATDPEGIPITYSIASDTSGNVATVTQGTGANTNVFTITPSTNTANAGTFSLTFRASDGVNIATAVSEFTLRFSVANSNYTTALITSVGANNAVNNSFDDASTNNHTITANGNVTQNTFSPYRHGGYSTYFDGAGDYLISDTNFTAIGTDDFTIEFWYNGGAQPARYPCIIGTLDAFSPTGAFRIMTYNDNANIFMFAFELTSYTFNTENYNDGVWRHFAVTREGTNLKGFVNGVQQGSTLTMGSNLTSRKILVAGQLRDNGTQEGYVSDVRVIKGTALYTSNFTPPTERLTAITNTSLLTCHLPYIADGSTNSHSITVNGNTKTEPFGPYDYSGYSASDNGGSMYFLDGSAYLTASPTAPSTGDFCYECWINVPQASDDAILETRTANQSPYGFTLTVFDSSTIRVYSNNAKITASGLSYLNQWTHLCVEKVGSTTTLYINGTSFGTTADLSNMSDTTFRIGESQQYGAFSGHIADFRYVRGGYVYNGNFTPPTAPLTAISGTELLINGTNAGIIDKSQSVKTITLNGDVKSSTTQSKYLTSSMYFDGTGDYLTTPASTDFYLDGEFTWECWVNCGSSYFRQRQRLLTPAVSSSTGSAYISIGNDLGINGGAQSGVFCCTYSVSVNPFLYANVNGTNTGTAVTVPLNQWCHLAITRDSNNNVKMWQDGVLVASGSYSGVFDFNRSVGARVGGSGWSTEDFGGYMSDVRITKGLARYTSNFTPPSAALQG
jgi:hypothetical protein